MFDLIAGLASTRAPEKQVWHVLGELAGHKSCLVRELASRTGISEEEALEALSVLEERGLARVSEDKGCVHERLAAITRRGRNEVRQAGATRSSSAEFQAATAI
jgi:DNA-binding MarR family transcriptional regulator